MDRRDVLGGIGTALTGGTLVLTGRYAQEGPPPSNATENGTGNATNSGEEFEVQGNTYYVSPAGDDGASGTEEDPYRTLVRAAEDVGPGDAILLRGGAYERDGEVKISGLAGRSDRPITIAGYPGEDPVFLFEGSPSKLAVRGGLRFTDVRHVTIQDVTVQASPYFGIVLAGDSADNRFVRVSTSDNGLGGLTLEDEATRTTVEDCVARDCGFDGFRLHVRSGYDNLFRRCESSGHADGGGNADGFNVTESYLPGTVEFERCVAHHCEDDGFDLWGGVDCTIDRCISYWNGYDRNGNEIAPGSSGNGFKLSGRGPYPGSDDGHGNNLYRSAVWGCSNIGVTCNENEVSPHNVYNVTAFDNRINFWLGYDQPDVARNCISHAVRHEDIIEDNANHEHNTWNQGIRDPGFRSEDPYDEAFLVLSADSPCIESGTDVGLDYCGDAPDLGAYEYSAGSGCETGLQSLGQVSPQRR